MATNTAWQGYCERAEEENAAPDSKVYRLLTVDDLAAMPPQRYRIKQVLPETGFAAIFGPSGSGKSFLSLDMAAAIAGRADWFGFRVRTGPVIYVCLEGEGGLRARIAAYRTEHGGDSLSGVRFVLKSFHILDDLPALARAVKAAGMDHPTIILDTLNRAAPGLDENSSVDMGKIIAACKALEAETGGLIILIHHTGKDGTKGLRGHSSLIAALDAAISVSRDGELRAWTLDKSKDGQDGKSFQFALKLVYLGVDDDGDQTTSCIINPDYDSKIDRQKPLGRNAQRALDSLISLTKQHQLNLIQSGKDPNDARVSVIDWCGGMFDMDKSIACRARKEVIDKGYAKKEGVYITLVDKVDNQLTLQPYQPVNRLIDVDPPLNRGSTSQPDPHPKIVNPDQDWGRL